MSTRRDLEPAVAAFDAAFEAMPLVAILRGVRPDEVVAVAEALCDAGIRIIEVPLNSPDPFVSIERLVKSHGARAVLGAGTVVTREDVRRLAGTGASLCISPHCDTDIIAEARDHGLVSIPGVLSPSEAYAAVKAGAHALKLFPMEMIGARGAKAMRAILPKGLRLIAVGGVTPSGLAELRAAGCDGFGLGSALYAPGDTPAVAAAKAAAFVKAMRGEG